MSVRDLVATEGLDPVTARAHLAKVNVARTQVRAIAHELAEQGLSAETIREAMLDMATDASDRAAKYIAEYDTEEAARVAIDREDIADDLDAREERVRGWGS